MGNLLIKESDIISKTYRGCTNTYCSQACTCIGNPDLYKYPYSYDISKRPIYKDDDELLAIQNNKMIELFREMNWYGKWLLYKDIKKKKLFNI